MGLSFYLLMLCNIPGYISFQFMRWGLLQDRNNHCREYRTERERKSNNTRVGEDRVMEEKEEAFNPPQVLKLPTSSHSWPWFNPQQIRAGGNCEVAPSL